MGNQQECIDLIQGVRGLIRRVALLGELVDLRLERRIVCHDARVRSRLGAPGARLSPVMEGPCRCTLFA